MLSKNKKKVIVAVIGCLLILCITICILVRQKFVEKDNETALINKFYTGDKLEYYENLYYKAGESIFVDDYIIMLDSVAYDGITREGCCLYIISADDRTVTYEEIKDRFSFYINCSHAYDFKKEERNQKVYFYQWFSVDSPWDETIYLWDRNINDGHFDVSESVGKFVLKNKAAGKTFLYKNNVLTLTPMAIEINVKEGTYQNITIVYKDKSEEIVMENGSKILSEGGLNKENIVKIVLDKEIDIENVEKVIVDGKGYIIEQ